MSNFDSMNEKLKFNVKLTLSQIKALALLGNNEMEDIVSRYEMYRHQFKAKLAKNMSTAKDIYSLYPTSVEVNENSVNKEDFGICLDYIIKRCEALLEENMEFYIWSNMHEFVHDVMESIKLSANSMLSENFDETYHNQYVKGFVSGFSAINDEFNKMHSIKS